MTPKPGPIGGNAVSSIIPKEAPQRLDARRLPLAQWLSHCEAASSGPRQLGLLGGMVWQPSTGSLPDGLFELALPALSPAHDTMVDVWLGAPRPRLGRLGSVRWRSDGHWVFGALDLPDAGQSVEASARQAYHDVFEALRTSGCPYLLRLWNYLPRINGVSGINETNQISQINGEGQGLERYRQFNAGRQQAFVDAGLDAFEGAPAACALGSSGGGLSLRFLAGRAAPLPIENPRQVPAYRYSTRYGPRAPTFSRAALADAGDGRLALFVSGTASIVGEESVHAGDLIAQLGETLRNLDAVIAAASARCTAALRLADLCCTVYVRRAADVAAVRAGFEAALGNGSLAAREAVYLQADVCRADLLLEIEAHTITAGALA